uniref:Uncharacterized protein n=1 Tax=Opuntia streptacantha TaxID=393608 RepID=A0A7C9B8R7_OPUST
MLEAKSLRKATVPSALLPYPSPGSVQPTRLALTVDDDDPSLSSCAYFASGSHVYKAQISGAEPLVHKGKESLLIPAHAEVIGASVTAHCPHRSEIQSIALTEMGTIMDANIDFFQKGRTYQVIGE